ncbi:MAG: protoheme IX farnesyltransferase [Acidobacteria bacterium]|nr:MAG: protoheme IX farnesyltransferase [Acidobacteriota bacterium]
MTYANKARNELGMYLEMSKARLSAMVVFSTIAGYLLSSRGAGHLDHLLWTALGTALAAFGASIFNQILETELDAKMERTQDRPLPSGRMPRGRAQIYGWASSVAGVVLLATFVNLLTSALALAVILVYTLVYTPMKIRTSANTLVGAVVGAVPPVIGWTAYSGRIEIGALILFGILFTWQVPHFLALAWMYREDYARGGFQMLPAVDALGRFTARTALVYALALQPLTLMVYAEGLSGITFLIIAQALGLAFAVAALPFYRERTRLTARRLFLASIIYLPLLLISMVGDMDQRVFNGAFFGAEPQAAVALANSHPPDRQ